MIEKFIESEANAKFKRWKKLARDARAVRKERATLMEGIHLMQVALESGCRVNAVLIDADRASREARELALELCRKSGADLFALSPALYDQLSPVEHGVGVMCEAAVPPAPADDAWKSADALYLDGVQDAGNAGTLIRIESEANAKFKRWKKLARDARAVRKERATLMEGIHLMQVALESGCRVNAVLIDADRASREARELALELCRKSGADLFALSPALYDQLSPVEHGVGVMCEAAVPPAPADDAWKSADALYLDGVQDAGNAGTLIRTAVAAGVRVVAASPVAATLWSPKVMRAGMGAHFGAVFIENITPEAFRRAYRGRIYAADARGGEDLFLAANDVAEGPVCWLMGAEGPGVSDAGLEAADRRFYIPIEAACESLNVGAAAAVCLFDTRRRRFARRGA